MTNQPYAARLPFNVLRNVTQTNVNVSAWFCTEHHQFETAVWQLQSKVVQMLQQHCLVWLYLDTAPAYHAENIRLTADVESRRHLRSSTTTTLVVPPVQRSTLGDRAFPVAAPRAWNSQPSSLRTVSSLVPFRHQLKTSLFVHSFDWHLLISPLL